MSFSPDGETLASGSWDGRVILWDVEAGGPTAVLEDGANAVSFSPDSSTLASGSYRTVKLWDVETGKQLGILEGHADGVTAVSFSPDGATLATGSWDRKIILWDVEARERIATLEGHTEGVTAVSFSPGGATLATGSRDRRVLLWDVEAREQVAALEGHTDGVTAVSFSPGGAILATGSRDRRVLLWDVEAGERIADLEAHGLLISTLSFSAPNGDILASGVVGRYGRPVGRSDPGKDDRFRSCFRCPFGVVFARGCNARRRGAGRQGPSVGRFGVEGAPALRAGDRFRRRPAGPARRPPGTASGCGSARPVRRSAARCGRRLLGHRRRRQAQRLLHGGAYHHGRRRPGRADLFPGTHPGREHRGRVPWRARAGQVPCRGPGHRRDRAGRGLSVLASAGRSDGSTRKGDPRGRRPGGCPLAGRSLPRRGQRYRGVALRSGHVPAHGAAAGDESGPISGLLQRRHPGFRVG